MSREAAESARERLKELLGGVEIIGRDEFDAVRTMAARARDENEELKARIEALEVKLAAKGQQS
jgi:BMFP domain-containing protein YqiC